MRGSGIVALVFVLSACGVNGMWVKNAPQSQINVERYECLRDAQRTQVRGVGGYVVSDNYTDDDMFALCMQSKGYRFVRQQ